MAITLQSNRQMYDEFQLVYNNLASNLAPGLDTFEISVYLTKAQDVVINQLYQSYEQKESSRKALIPFVKDEKIAPYRTSNLTKICKDSVFFVVPDDVLWVVYESINMKDSNNVPKCYRCREIKVTPVTHDDFNNIYQNPFRFNDHTALRLDVSSGTLSIAEIVFKNSDIENYYIRYVKKPKPIILEDLNGETIQGVSDETACEFNIMYHSDIVRTAAELAYQDYKKA